MTYWWGTAMERQRSAPRASRDGDGEEEVPQGFRAARGLLAVFAQHHHAAWPSH